MKTRKTYTTEEKTLILYEYSLGKKSNEAFKSAGIDVEKLQITDKKYASKLINKWKKDLYKKNKSNNFYSQFLNNSIVLKAKRLKENINDKDIIFEDYIKLSENKS